jgi:pimeloyl-ACP methyl ester carboxylesterase
VTVSEGRLQANGLAFRYLAAGPEQAPLYLLLHGFPEGAESWLPQLEALEKQGSYRAVAPDLRGYGGTDAPDGVENYRMQHLIADVGALATALGHEQFHLAGHDWGAAIGWAFAIGVPDRVLGYTALSVPHPAPFFRAMAEDEEQKAKSWYIGFFRDGQRAEDAFLRDGMKALRDIYDGKLPDDVVDRYVEGFRRPGRLTAALNYYRAAGELAVPARDLRVRVPTLLIWGDQDVAIGRKAVAETEDLVDAPYRLEVLHGAGHWLQYERPGEVSALLVEHASRD